MNYFFFDFFLPKAQRSHSKNDLISKLKLVTECEPLCRMDCPFGNVIDNRGCPICKCKQMPSFLLTKPSSNVTCGPVCRMWCEYGNVLDERGCAICKCKPAP